jgi:hypothetical protein
MVMIVLLAFGFGYRGTQATQRADELSSQLQESVQQGVERLRQYQWAKDICLMSQACGTLHPSRDKRCFPKS